MIPTDLAVRGGPAPDGEPDVLMVRLEKVRSDRVPKLMSRDRDPVALRVLNRDSETGLDVAHRFTDILPAEGVPSVFERVEQRE